MHNYVLSGAHNTRRGSNKWAGWADFFRLLHENRWKGGQVFRLFHDKQQAGWTNFQNQYVNGHALLLDTLNSNCWHLLLLDNYFPILVRLKMNGPKGPTNEPLDEIPTSS